MATKEQEVSPQKEVKSSFLADNSKVEPTGSARNLVLIPSSRFVDSEMQLEVGQIPPALIPVNGRPLLEAIINTCRDLEGHTDFFVSCCEGMEFVNEYANRLKNYPEEQKSFDIVPQIVPVDSEQDLGTSICEALWRIDCSQYDNLIINFGDTLIDADINLDTDAIFYDDLRESFRWTTFKEEDGLITEITDKNISDFLNDSHVFSGLFIIKDPKLFLSTLENSKEMESVGRFYSALSTYLSKVDYKIQKVNQWYDFGHVDNYSQVRKQFVNKRFFNQVNIDPHRAIVTKQSTNIEKFSGEIKWYLELPSTLKCYIPQIFDYSLSPKNSFVKMEYYGYPTLAELYLSRGRSLGIWSHAFNAVFRVVEEMKAHQLHLPLEDIQKALQSVYVDKTLSRLNELKQIPEFKSFFDNEIIVNGKTYESLSYYESQVPLLYEKLLKDLNFLSVIHGDLCCSNLLYDPKSRIVKLIDPRGKFGDYTIYGDFRYELAKLSHSFNGYYDAIVADLFIVNQSDRNITYEILADTQMKTIAEMFNGQMEKLYADHLQAVDFIESLLFLSMVPLHGDYVHRQMIMLATGVEKIDKVLQGMS